ncbi:MAG: hypothetical protein QOD02_3936 [Mycobacterium sp.]|nr:hypothetical protein [Mycobacterium sp.]
MNAGNPISPTGPCPTAATSRSSTGSMITRDTCCPAPPTGAWPAPTWWPASPPPPPPPACRPPPSPTTDRSTPHDSPTPQRLRTPAGQSGHHSEKRSPRTPPDPRQNRTLPPNPQTLAGLPTPARHHHRHANPARRLRRHLQHRAHPPRPTPGTTPAQAYQARPKASPPNTAAEHFRIRHDVVDQFGKTHPPPRQPPAPPRHRPHPRTHPRTDPGDHHHRHRRQQKPPPRPQQPPRRPRPQLLAQPNKNPGRWPGNL